MATSEDFYVRYYVGHKGKFGHEFLEFEFRPDGMETSLEALKVVCKDVEMILNFREVEVCKQLQL